MKLDKTSLKIITESLKVLILASVISTIGGVRIEAIRVHILAIIPLLILLPALNDVAGAFGTVISSKFTSMLYMGKIRGKWWKSRELHKMFTIMLVLALVYSVYVGFLASVVATLWKFQMTMAIFYKIVSISVAAITSLVVMIFFISVVGGIYIHKKELDPDNFLIPITTSLADLGNMAIFAMLVRFFFLQA